MSRSDASAYIAWLESEGAPIELSERGVACITDNEAHEASWSEAAQLSAILTGNDNDQYN